MPTLVPGCHFVPRWRTMMLPGMTRSPPNFLTPSRLPAESRPLRELPPAFLCAMTLYPSLAASGRDDVRDADHGLELPVAVAPPVVLAPPLLEDDDLLALALLEHGGRHLGPRDGGRPDHRALAADHQHLAELDRAAGLALEPLDDKDLVLGDAVLLAAGLDHCVHGADAGPEIGTQDSGR